MRRRAAGRRQRQAQAMAAHTAEEARFDNIKAHFGLDAGGILVALRSWQHLQQIQVAATGPLLHTMGFGSTTRVLAKHMLKYCRILGAADSLFTTEASRLARA